MLFRYRLRPRVLTNVSRIDMSTSVLGSNLNFPVCVAATAMNKMAHDSGEVAAAKGIIIFDEELNRIANQINLIVVFSENVEKKT